MTSPAKKRQKQQPPKPKRSAAKPKNRTKGRGSPGPLAWGPQTELPPWELRIGQEP